MEVAAFVHFQMLISLLLVPLRITFCAYDKPDNIGGPVSWMLRLLPALRSRGIESRVLFLMHWGDTGPALAGLRGQGFECIAVPAHPTTEERVRWILQCLRDNPPDVFVPNLVVAGYFAARWVRQAGIPTVGILHSDDPFYRAIQQEFVFGRKQFRLSVLVSVSRALEEQVKKLGPADTLLERIPYGVSIPVQRSEQKFGRLRLAYVGRLAEEQKRISEVAQGLCAAVSQIPGCEAVIYGDGPDRENVEIILANEGRGLPVHMGGRIEVEEISDRLLEFDVIVLLSDYEGLPIALLEAMACGCVPVCLQMGSGIPELVQHEKTGLLADDRGDSFVTAIRRLYDDPALRERLAAGARRYVEENYSLDVCTDRWVELFHELRAQAGPQRAVQVPRFLRLPPPLPGFAHQDPRASVVRERLRRGYVKARMWAGKVRRRVLG